MPDRHRIVQHGRGVAWLMMIHLCT
jgi:hypothetical protein